MSKSDINNFTGSGRIGKDIEVRFAGEKGIAVTDVSVCMNVGFGQRQKPVWTRLTVWGKQAEFLGKYAHKGDLLLWTGAQYQIEEFTGRDGDKKRTHYFEIGQGGQVNLLESKGGGSGGEREQEELEPEAPPPADNRHTGRADSDGW